MFITTYFHSFEMDVLIKRRDLLHALQSHGSFACAQMPNNHKIHVIKGFFLNLWIFQLVIHSCKKCHMEGLDTTELGQVTWFPNVCNHSRLVSIQAHPKDPCDSRVFNKCPLLIQTSISKEHTFQQTLVI